MFTFLNGGLDEVVDDMERVVFCVLWMFNNSCLSCADRVSIILEFVDLQIDKEYRFCLF